MSETHGGNSEVVPPELRALEEELVEEVNISASPTEAACEILGLPKRVKGMTIVDLAAGASPLTSDLLKAGADIYALDCVYNRSDEELHQLIEEYHREIVAIVDQDETMNQMVQRGKEVFWQSYNTERERYLDGWLTELPFPDGFADLTISLEGATHVGADDPILLEYIIQEALRITKPGGMVRMSPLYSKIHVDLITKLSQQKDLTVTHELPENADRYPKFRRMTIIKS